MRFLVRARTRRGGRTESCAMFHEHFGKARETLKDRSRINFRNVFPKAFPKRSSHTGATLLSPLLCEPWFSAALISVTWGLFHPKLKYFTSPISVSIAPMLWRFPWRLAESNQRSCKQNTPHAIPRYQHFHRIFQEYLCAQIIQADYPVFIHHLGSRC